MPDSYTIGDVTYLKMPGQVSEIKSVYYNDPSDNTYSITYYNPNNTTDYDVALKYVEEGTNDLLMQKSFHVNNQDYTYVLPKTMKINDIYYGLAENQENIIHHAVSSDVREYTVYYKKMDENASYKWSIYKVDASTNKILGKVVQLEVQPGQSVEYQVEKEYKDSDGNVYTVDQGMSQVLKHSYGESEHVSYVYYNPKGYTAPKNYIVEVQYKNIATDETIASQKIEIIKTLEDGSKATNGAYEYRLAYVDSQNNETLIYDSSTVGGDSSQGLKEIKGLDDYFYLGRLAKNDVGYVTLTLSVDGETQGNSYQATMAQLEMNFAVENVSNPAVTVNKIEHKNVYSTVKTGDSTNILWYCALGLVSGLLLIILAIFFKKKSKDEKKGE